ncbi:MAG: PepSY-associated TM helix domain-containing protein [Candidatus Marinimicrobia bacterium]|nr:PepSY-associated TM helix domain-containing protein [Candidatus Neomarinimicrobiota bacterium]
MTLIYSLSGIALNHMADWNPSYSVNRHDVQWTAETISPESVRTFLAGYGYEKDYKQHYQPTPDQLKIFLKDGSAIVDLQTGVGGVEFLKRRPLFFEVNYLHYNPKLLWTWFSDLFCVALILIAITGLFIIKGKKGITGRGAWMTILGILVPLAFLIAYL